MKHRTAGQVGVVLALLPALSRQRQMDSRPAWSTGEFQDSWGYREAIVKNKTTQKHKKAL